MFQGNLKMWYGYFRYRPKRFLKYILPLSNLFQKLVLTGHKDKCMDIIRPRYIIPEEPILKRASIELSGPLTVFLLYNQFLTPGLLIKEKYKPNISGLSKSNPMKHPDL